MSTTKRASKEVRIVAHGTRPLDSRPLTVAHTQGAIAMPHTPGPWEVCLDGYTVRTDANLAVATAWELPRDDQFKSTMKANARLIAAAPELLAALERLLSERNQFVSDTETCECGENGNGRDDAGNVCEHIQAQRAIAKATGKA